MMYLSLFDGSYSDVTVDRIGSCYKKLLSLLDALDTSTPKISQFSARLRDYLYFLSDVGEDTPLTAGNILPLSRTILANRHAMAIFLHPMALLECNRIYHSLRSFLRHFSESLVVMDNTSMVANLVRALAEPDDLDSCLDYYKKAILRRTAPDHDSSMSGLSDHDSDSGLEPEHDRVIGQPPK
jgi:hypothetical protein